MKDTIKRIISILLVISILSISVFAVDPEEEEEVEEETGNSGFNLPDYEATSGNLQIAGNFTPPPTGVPEALPPVTDPDVSETVIMGTLGLILQALSLIPNGGSDTGMNNINGHLINIDNNIYGLGMLYGLTGGIGSKLNQFLSQDWTKFLSASSYSNIVNLYDLWQKLNILTLRTDENGLITNKLKSIINNTDDTAYDTNLIQSDIRGIYNMFASGVSGGSYYFRTFNELYNPNDDSGVISNISVSSSNTAAGVATTNSTLTELFTWTDGLNHSGLTVYKDHNGHNFLNGIDSSTSDLLNYFYAYFIDDDRPNSMNGGELIYGIYDRLGSISSSLGYSSSSSLSSDIADLVDSQDDTVSGLGQISRQLDDIIDVLANDEDQTIVDNSTNNKNTIVPIFFNTDVDVDTSLHPSDFTGLGNIVKAIRGLLNVGVPISGFSAALSEAADEGLEFFSQTTVDDLYNLGGT